MFCFEGDRVSNVATRSGAAGTETGRPEPKGHCHWMTHVVMYAAPLFEHTAAHVEPMKEHCGNPERSLRQFYHGPGL